MSTPDLIDEIRRNATRYFSRRSPAEIAGSVDVASFAHWRDCRVLLTEIDRLRQPRRIVPTSDDTIAMPTPATAMAALLTVELPPKPVFIPIDPGDQFAYASDDDTTIGWNACVIAAEDRVAAACAGVIRTGGSVVDARTQSLIAIRGMRRTGA